MTLAPAPPQASGGTSRHAVATVSDAASGSGSGGGGNSGSGASDPKILVSGGAVGGGGTGTNNTIPTTIPIGTVFTCTVTAPGSKVLATETWAGQGAVGKYIPSNLTGSDAPPPSMAPVAPVTNTPGTTFLVVLPSTNYTVDVKVTYVGGGGGESSVKFTSGKMPTYTYLGQVRKIQENGQMVNVPPPAPNVPNNRSSIQFTNANGDGMGIEAQTSTTFPGDYMLMQLASMLRQYTDGTNTYQYANTANNPNNLQAFDNGLGGLNNTLGMQVAPVTSPGQVGANQWTQGNTPSQDYVAFDPVFQGPPSQQGLPAPTRASVGGLNGGGNETYTTYLMYEPGNNIIGEWVAIGKVTWGWGGTANVQNGSFAQPILSPSTGPVNDQALNAYLPSWNTTTSAIVAAGWKKA